MHGKRTHSAVREFRLLAHDQLDRQGRIQADKDRVLGQLQASLQLQAYNKLAESLQQGEFIPPETVSTFTLAETYDRFSGEQAEELGLQLQLVGTERQLSVAVMAKQAVLALFEFIETMGVGSRLAKNFREPHLRILAGHWTSTTMDPGL